MQLSTSKMHYLSVLLGFAYIGLCSIHFGSYTHVRCLWQRLKFLRLFLDLILADVSGVMLNSVSSRKVTICVKRGISITLCSFYSVVRLPPLQNRPGLESGYIQ